MVTEKPMKYKILIVFSAVIVSAFLILLALSGGNLAIITINRPKALNALNSETLRELDLAITNIENDNNVYCVILTGAGGKSFVAGADIAEMKDLDSNAGKEFGLLGNKIFRKLESLDKPVIAAISGFALGGGCELAMACDIRIASEKARFAQPEAGLGITPGFGGTQRLPRIVGLGKAKELIYTCSMINAEEALKIGLVNKVVPLENLMEEAKKMAFNICKNAPIAVLFAWVPPTIKCTSAWLLLHSLRMRSVAF